MTGDVKTFEDRTCDVCGEIFAPRVWNQKRCDAHTYSHIRAEGRPSEDLVVYRLDLSNGMQYVGLTNNLERRLKEHSNTWPSTPSKVAAHLRENNVHIAECTVLEEIHVTDWTQARERKRVYAIERRHISKLTKPLNFHTPIRRKRTYRKSKSLLMKHGFSPPVQAWLRERIEKARG